MRLWNQLLEERLAENPKLVKQLKKEGKLESFKKERKEKFGLDLERLLRAGYDPSQAQEIAGEEFLTMPWDNE